MTEVFLNAAVSHDVVQVNKDKVIKELTHDIVHKCLTGGGG